MSDSEGVSIAFVSHRADRTGAPLCMLDLICHRSPRRHPVRVLLGEEGPLVNDLAEAGVIPEILPRKASRGTRQVLAVRQVLRRWKADVVHLTSAVGFTKSAALAARSLRQPVLWHLHDDFGNPKFRRRRTWVRMLAQRIVACSHSVAQDIQTPRTSVIENGVVLPPAPDAASRFEARRRLGLPEDATVVLFVGSFTPRKNTRMIAEAAASLVAIDDRLHFLLVGGGDKPDYRAETEAAARGSSRIHFHPECADVDGYYRAADLMVMPSTMECHPRVLLEASAFSVPSLASAVGDVPRMIRDGASGWLHQVPPDAEAFSATLAEVLARGPDEWRARGRAARTDLAECCSMERYVDAFEREWCALARAPRSAEEPV